MSDKDQIIAEFRENGGVVGGHFEGKHLLLLHTLGKATGREYVNPLVYATEDATFIVSASNRGAEKEPLLVANVEAADEVTIEVAERTLKAKPTVWRDGPERDRLYSVLTEYWPEFHEYEKHTDRTFPVIQLDAIDTH
ncbi:nitroreductase/quinone reductase family protein [Streptomyces sp. NPDC088725]|uniref:nitroreductase/quinone reductase family protein n=1 Tax=Streptomyces sp. NPDC088725 TaxID=3365873 RepID=UPI0037F81BFD